jgi:uncharacterized pyridoxamine 5'-phosphate oxidase family protein
MSSLDKVVSFLESAGTYFLATAEGDQPRVRPFGTVLLYENRIYIQTGKVKEVSKQIAKNPNVEISAFKDGKWIRVSGNLKRDERVEVKKAMLDKYPNLRGMYDENDANTELLYFEDGVATISSFTDKPIVIKL